MAKNKGMRERTGQASSSVKKSRRQQRKSSLRPKSKVPPDLKDLESTISVRSSSIKKSILKVQVPVPKQFIIHKIASTSACSRSMEEILSVQVPVPKEIVKHLRKTTSDTEPLLPPVLPSNGTKKDSREGQNGSTSYNKNSTIGLNREDLDGKERSDPGGKLRGHGEENTNEKLDLKSETEGTSRTQSLHGKVFVKNLATEKTEASITKSGGTGIADTKENRKTPGGKMNANFTSGKIVKAENRRLKARRMAEKALLIVKETCTDTKNSVTSKEVLGDAGSGQKVDHGILSKQNVTDTPIEKSSVSREVKITQKSGTAPGNGTKCRSTTMAGGKAKNSSASDASKVESIANSSTKREANVAGERQFVKSNNNDPKMSDCGDMQVNHTCASNKNNVNDKKDNRSSLFNGQSSTKPQTVAFGKVASSSPNVKFIKEVFKRVHKAMAMATTSTNNGALSSSKSTNKVSSTSENSDAEKSTNEKKSIEDELKQEDEDGPWVNDEIKKQIDLRNGAYKLFLKKRDEKVLNYYLRLKERIRKMIAHAKQRHLTGKAMTDCVGTVKQKALEFNEVVLIFDKQDEHLYRKLKRLCPRASYIYKENIDYRNAFDSIQGHQSFGKKTLYVMVCGALTALYSEVDPTCLNKGCTPVYRRYRLVSEDADSIYNHLVEHALLLRKNVEANNTDRVIFLEIIIADLDALESLEIKCHFKNCGHKPERYFRHTPWKSTLAAAFFRFNFWLLEDKEERGFSCWCLEGLLLNYLKIGVMNMKIKTRGKIKWHPLRRRRLRMVCLAVQETLIDSEGSSVSSRHVPTKIAPPDCEMEARSDILIVYEKMGTGNVVNEKRATEPSRSESQNTTKERQIMEQPALQTVDKGLAGELHIVVIFDDQDSCLEGVKFPFVTSIFSKNFDFFSGCASVESLPPKQNALIIVLSGIKTVVKLSMDPECMRVGCSQKLYRISPTLTDSDSILKELVSGALLFRKRVTEGKSRYRVVFSGLLPPSLYHIDKYAVDNHYRQCNHKAPLHSKEYFAAMNLVLGDAVRKYNTWAKDDASIQGFLGWDIESIFTTESSKIFHHELEHDGVSLTHVCQEKRKNALKGAIEYTHTILVPAVQESSRSSDELKFIPTAITLVFDETQDFLANIKMPLVSYLNTSNSHIRFQDVHAEIKSLKYARERTLYVIFGGIETVFRLTEDSDCRFFSCHSPLKRIELLSERDDVLAKMLVSYAQSLKREIERINKCKVIFRTLLPIDLKTVDEYAIREHLRRCKHQARYHPKGWLEKQNRTLALAVDRFNVWARSDARQLGLCDWNVDDIFAGLTIGSDFMFLPDTRVDGRSLTRKWESLMTEVITTSLEKTFDAINQIKENKKVETSGSRPCTVTPNMLSSFSKAENHQFDHVAIVVNTLYSHILQDFQSPRVTVIEAEQLTVCQIPRLVKQHHCGKDKKILWLLPVGIYSLTEFYQHPSCQHCASPLHVLTLGHDGLPSEEYMMNHNKDMLQKARALYQVLQQELGPDAFVLFVPPIRAMVVVKEMFQSHPLLHKVCEMNNAFCADAEMLSVLREYYNRFCELWKSLVPGKFSALSSLSIITKYQIENQGQNVVPIVDDEDYTFAVEIWKDMLKDFIRESLGAVHIDQNSISIHPDKGKHILHELPNRKCVSTVQSGQNMGNNILPKPRNTHSISAFQSGQTIGNHILPKTPNRQSITAVQSGQTIGENSSPKPLNKHSITAVQSGQTTGENSSPKPLNKHSITAVQSGQTIGENSSPKSGQTTGENSSPKPPNKHSITAVQSGQTKGKNTLPKPLNKHSITAVQSGQTTEENSSPKPPIKHSITAVQSGQTIGENSSPKSGQTTGENSSPKPPNKHSITAVQSGQTKGKNTLPKPPNKQFITAVQSGQKTALVSNTGKKDMFKSFDTMSLNGVENAQITSSAISNAGKEGLNCERMSHTNVSKIEHIIVVGSKNVCACIESIQNQFPITFIHENVDFSEECIKRFAAYQENVPFRTAWIILTDILLLTKQSSSDTPCSNARCQNPFEYDILKTDVNFPFMVQKVIIERMVDEVLANIISFAMNLIKELTPGSFVYFTPIAPLRGMIIPPTTQHDRIHALKKLGPDVRLLKGTYLCWIRCARNFSKMWKKFMLENTSTSVVHDLLVKYYFNKSVCCLVPVYDENTIKGNSIQETRWRFVVKEMIQKIALSKGEYPNSSLGPFALRFNPKKSEAASEKGVPSARQPQAKATDKAKVEKTAGSVLRPASDVPVTSLSEKANRATKAPQDLSPLSTDGPPSTASTTLGGSPGNVSTSMNSSLLKKTAAVNSLNQSKSGGIVSTLPYKTVSETSSSCTTAKVAVSSTIPHKAQGSVSPITAKRKSTEPSVIQIKTSNKTLNRDVKNTVESAHGTSGIRDSREVSGKTSSVAQRPSLEENCKNVLKSSNTVKEPHLLGNEKEHSVSLSSLKTCENVSGRKDVCKTNAVQSSKPNKNIIGKNMLSATMKTLPGKSPGRSSNAVDIKNEATSCFASQENVSGKTETCCETFYEKLMPNKLTSEKLCHASKMSLSKVSLESPEVTSKLSPRKLPLEVSENVTVSSDNCGTYVVSPNTLSNTGESSVATESVSLVKGSSKITSIPETADKDKDMNLSSSNQKAPFGTVASLSGDTSQAKSCAEAVQADSSYTELNQRPSTVVSTNPNEGQDLLASIPKDKISSKRKPRAVLDSVSSESELASKASVVKSEPVSGETNKMSSVSTTIPQASIVDTSVKVSNSKATAEPQASSANIIPLAKESCSGTSSPKKGGTPSVTSKPAPSSVALVIQSRSGSPSSVKTMAKIPAPTCIVHPTKVHDKVLSSHKGIVAEIHSSLKTSSVTTTVPSGSGRYTLAVKDHGSVPLKMVTLNEGIPTAVVTPKINLQKNCSVAKPSSSKVEDPMIVKDPSNQTTYGIILMNIHRSIKDEDLKVLFEACGQVHSMQRPSNILGKPAEYCVVKFLSHDVALRAKQLFSAVILAGKPLEVKSLENYAENSSENVSQADRLMYHKLEKIAMKCKVNLSLKDEMLIQYTTQERLENDGLPNPSKGGRSDNKEDDEISLSSVSLSSLEDSDDDKIVSKGTGRKVYGKGKADTNVKDCQKVKAAATGTLRETCSSSTSRAGGQGLHTLSKDTRKPQKKSSLSSKGTMNDETFVKVSNLSDVVPWEIVDRLLQACGALDKGKFEETSGAKVYQFPTYKSALLAEGQLKGLRLLDKILNVKMMCNTSGKEPVLKLDEEMKIRNHALLVLGDYENIMVSVAKTIAESGVNVYSFKTKLCTKESCASHQLCHDYHSAEDRRRNPLLYNYSSTMCNTVRNSKECKRHDKCEDAHSTVEILFHKTKFRSHICVGWSTLRACPMGDKVCPFAHPDCPDLFFHPDWEDLYVEGLHNTLLFLSGAILNHFRLQLSGSRNEVGHSTQRSVPCVRILVITPSADMVKLYAQAVKELALTCNMEVTAVTLGTATRDSSVLIGTPASLSKLLAEEKSKTSRKQHSGKALGTISNIRAIILDDASSVLKEFSSVSHQALERLLGTPGINKVAISEVISVSEVHKTSRLFNCKLKELPVREQPQSDNIKITKEVFESAAQSIPKRTFSPVQDQACRNTSSPTPQSQLFDKSKSGNITHSTVAHAQSHGLIGESSPLSPVSDTETVLYSAGGRSPLLSASPSSSPPASPRKGFMYEKPLNVPQELSSAKRQRTSCSSGGEVSSQCRKKLRSSYYSRDYSPSSSSSSRDYPSYYAFPKYNENFLEESSSQRHDSKPYDKRHKSFHHNSEDEISPLSEYSTRRHSRSNSHRRKSQLPEQLPRRWKTSSRHSSNSSDRDTQRHKSRSPKRSSRGREMSSRRRKRSSDRSEKYNSESSEVSPKRKHHRSSEYENCRRHHSSSKDSKKRHKCKKHLSKHFCSSSVRQRETSLSSILLTEEQSKDDDGKRKSGLEDAATRSSHQVKKPSDTGVQSPPPLKKHSKSEEVGESNLSEAKEDLSAAVHFLKPEKGPVLLDKVPSWSEVTKHQNQQNLVLLKSKDILSKELCKNPEKDVAISGMPSPSEKDITTSRMPSPCENCRIKFDPETDEEFLQLEKTMKEMHTADYQVFLDSPEVHPDYDSSYLMFEQCYQQRYGNKNSNENRQSVWTMFWAELVHDQEKEEWTVKREGLLKQFENDRKNCKCASEIEESLGKENECSSDSSDVIFISESISSNSQSPPSASGAFCLANPSSSVANDSEGVRKPQTSASRNMEDNGALLLNLTSEKDLDPLLSESLIILDEVCDSLGEFFGSLLKKVIGRVKEFSDTREAFLYLGKEDTIKLLEMTEEKIRSASITAEGSQKNKLFYGGQLIKRLISYASQASTCSEFDISQLAKATMNRDTSFVLNMIRERMKTHGIKNPPVDAVRQVYSEVSSWRLKTVLSDM